MSTPSAPGVAPPDEAEHASPGKAGYHHGDLRTALLRAALPMLETGEPFSLRALARQAGVSPNAPYRHFADRDALESALAAQGLRELGRALAQDSASPSPPTTGRPPAQEALAALSALSELAVRYVRFARTSPGLFRLMFTNACENGATERAEAAAQVHAHLRAAVQRAFPGGDHEALATAGWAYAHGMATLHAGGKLPATSPEQVDERVRAGFTALLTATTKES